MPAEAARVAALALYRHSERWAWRLRPAELLLGWGAAAGYVPGSVSADSERIYRMARLQSAEAEPG